MMLQVSLDCWGFPGKMTPDFVIASRYILRSDSCKKQKKAEDRLLAQAQPEDSKRILLLTQVLHGLQGLELATS